MSRLHYCVLALVFLLLTSPAVSAQSPTLPNAPSPSASTSQTPTTQTDSTSDSTNDSHDQAERELREQMQQRMLGVVPAFTTVYNGHAAPLNDRQKFRLWVADTVDPFDFAAAGVDAALEYHSHEFPEYGYGFSGYAKRYGASFTDDAVGTFFAEFVLPSTLHQDPRYFRLGTGSIIRRLNYTLLSAVRCRSDDFRWQPNVSLLGGNLIGGAISNAYYPPADRGLALTFERSLTVTGEDLLSSLATEFYPDIVNAFHRHKEKSKP